MVRLTDDGVLFAKNSDRDPNEAQLLEWHPAAVHAEGAEVTCTWISVPQTPVTRAVLISRPWWMWGAEMGANDAGLVIGNEAVFTDAHESDPGLLGMDLLRLALERSTSAEDAVGTIVELLEQHGQGGPCSRVHPGFSYDNSFLIADPEGAVVLETAGRSWVTEVVTGPGRSISNGLTIEPFATAHADRPRGRVAQCDLRRRITTDAVTAAADPADLMSTLRSHGRGIAPLYSPVNGAMAAPCMHAGGVLTNSQTTASWVADLRRPPAVHWVTGTAAPCTGLFKPVLVDSPVQLGAPPTDRADDRSLWWRHERLHRLVARDPLALAARYTRERDRTEVEWLAEPPTGQDAFDRAGVLLDRWIDDVGAGPGTDQRPSWVRWFWRRQDRLAGLDTPTTSAT